MSATPHAATPKIAGAPQDERANRSMVAVVGFLVFIELCSGILQGSMPAITPLIGRELSVSSGDLNWVSSVTLLVSGVSVPLLAKLGDIHGHRRVIRWSMIVVAIGSVIVATADSFGMLLVGRALQGLFAAWLPLEFAIVRDRVDAKRAGAAIGMLVGALSLGATLGAVGVGLLSREVSGIHALLWLPAAGILLCLPIAFLLIPESVTRNRSRVDWTGAALLTTGLGAGLLALARGNTWGWDAPRVLALVTLAFVLLGLFVLAEMRSQHPLVDVRMVARRSMAPLYVLSFFLGCVLYGTQTASATFMATPSELGFGFGFGTLGLALMTLPWGIGVFLGAAAADRLVHWAGPRTTISGGFAIVTASFAVMVIAHEHPWQLVVALSLLGVGGGLVLGSLPTLIMAGLPADQTGMGTGVDNTLRALAGSVFGAVTAALMNRHLLELPIPGVELANEHAYVLIWTSCGAMALIGMLIALMVRTPPADDTTTSDR